MNNCFLFEFLVEYFSALFCKNVIFTYSALKYYIVIKNTSNLPSMNVLRHSSTFLISQISDAFTLCNHSQALSVCPTLPHTRQGSG